MVPVICGGVMGLVYNPSAVSKEDVRHWSVLLDEKYRKQVTMKDSVRDSYLVALTILKEKKIVVGRVSKSDGDNTLSDGRVK